MASTELAVGYISIAASTSGLGKQISREFAGIERKAEQTGRKSGSRMSSGMGAALKGATAIAGGAALALAGVATAGFAAGVKTAAGMEQARISFETMLGSATKADAFLRDLQKFAASTPFEFPELQTAASSLISAGIEADKVIPIMRTLGDVTSGMGTGSEGVQRATIALQQMAAAGRITGEDLNQLRDAGIPVFDLLASATGKSKKEVVELAQAGKLGQKELGAMMKALETGKGLERFSGLMAKQSQSLMGMWSTLSDTFSQGMAEAIQPILPILKQGMEQATAIMEVAFRRLPGIINGSLAAFRDVRAFVVPLATAFGDLASRIGQTANSGGFIQTRLVPAFQGIVAAGQRLGAVVLPIVRQLSAAFLREWPKIQPVVVGVFTTLQGIVTDVMGYIQARIAQATMVIDYIWSRWGDKITKITVAVFKVIFDVIGGTLKVVGGIIKVLLALMTGDFRKAAAGFKQIWQGLKQILVGIAKGIQTTLVTIFGGLFNSLRAKFTSGVDAIGRAWDALKEKAKAPIRFVVNTVINDGLIGAFNKIAAVIPGVGALPRVSVGFHRGGIEPGRSSWRNGDTMLRGFRPGEGVTVSEALTDSYERARLLALNKWTLAGKSAASFRERFGYAKGGLVGGSGRFSPLFESRLLMASQLAGTVFNIFQRGFRPATSYSGTSHQGDAVDLGPITTAVIKALRSVGIAAWDRTGKGNWSPHIHGVPLPGAGYAAGSAVWQAQDYLRGGDGLGGRDNGPNVGVLGKIGAFIKSGFASFSEWFGNLVKDPLAKLKSITGTPFGQLVAGVPRMLVEGMRNKIGVFDQGGRLQPGLSFNGTRRSELVLNRPQERIVERALDVANGGGGTNISGNTFYGVSEAFVDQLADALDKRARRQRALQPSSF